MEETIDELIANMRSAEDEGSIYGLEGRPKAIYVCNTNIVEGNALQREDPNQPFKDRQSPPILIWRYLTEHCGINPDEIAVYCSLNFRPKYPPPVNFHLFKGGDADYGQFVAGSFRHIIFNLSLQEGWDDPLCYFAYIDKSMDSRVQVEQIIGRLLRQPGARHYSAERLNAAHFYVRVDRNQIFNEILDQVAKRLSTEAPELKIIKSPPDKKSAREYQPKANIHVAETAYISDDAVEPIAKLIEQLTDYRRDSGVNISGVGSRRLTRIKVGDESNEESPWEDFNQSNMVSARWVFQREVRKRFQSALGVAPTSDQKFDARIAIGSKAYTHIIDVADKVVQSFLDNVFLRQRRADPYKIGPLLAREEDVVTFKNAVHEGYTGLNGLELRFARELDTTGLTWCRNPARSGYGIPLLTIGPTDNFYPDFIVWKDDDVFAIDTTGGHLLPDKVVRKLLSIQPAPGATSRLHIRFVSEGTWSDEILQKDSAGFTIWGLKHDNSRRVAYVDELREVLDRVLRLSI